MFGLCIFYNYYFKGTQINDSNYIYMWKKKEQIKTIETFQTRDF